MRPVADLIGSRQNKGVIVVGASPALASFNWNLLDGCYTIAVNRAICGNAKFTFWLHSEPCKQINALLKFKPHQTLYVSPYKYNSPDYLYTHQRGFSNRSYEKSELSSLRNVTIAALDFANLLGANEIGLLGVDFVCIGNKYYFDETVKPALMPWVDTTKINLSGKRWCIKIYQTYASIVDDAISKHLKIYTTCFSDYTLLKKTNVVPLSKFSEHRDRFLV